MERQEVQRGGHNVFKGPALSTVGVVYIAIVIIYTGLLLYGLGVLWLHRNKSAVRIRGFLITTAAVLSIHAYVAALFIVYPLNGAFKCGTEFWYMNTLFPLGIALFQASNLRLWQYAKAQRQFQEMKCLGVSKKHFKFSLLGVREWIRHSDELKRTYFFIAMGLVVQLIVAFVLFFGSRRFSPATGFFGQDADPLTCRRGYEWIPSVFWQCFWAWFFGPIVLFKTRHIQDTHFWALQTRLAVIAGLPGTPLWLAFLYGYNPTMGSIEKWWPPAMWFAPGLMVMQITSILFPAYDIYRHRKPNRSISPAASVSSVSVTESVSSNRKSRELAISLLAFEHQLKHDLPPLLEFSTEKDFTSENVMFLRDVHNLKLKWRRHISMAPTVGSSLSTRDMRTMYEDAARIYFELVCPGTAPFPINLDSRMYYNLNQMFQSLKYEPAVLFDSPRRSASTVSKQKKDALRRVIAPWESPPDRTAVQPVSPPSKDSSSSETAFIDIILDDQSQPEAITLPPPIMAAEDVRTAKVQKVRFEDGNDAITSPGKEDVRSDTFGVDLKGKISNRHRGNGPTASADFVPTAFGLDVFDAAYESVKYLVYTNTWKSFVQALDEIGIERLASLWSCPPGLTPRRGLKGASDGKMSHMTDVEMYDLNLELQAEHNSAGIQQFHHGVLDFDAGPVPIEECDARCGACRRKIERRVERIVRQAGFDVHEEACRRAKQQEPRTT